MWEKKLLPETFSPEQSGMFAISKIQGLYVMIQLTLEQHKFELCTSTYP